MKHQRYQLSLLRSEFQLDMLHQNDGEKDARTGRRQQDRGTVKADDDEPGRLCFDKFFSCEQSDCVGKAGDTQILKSTDWSTSGKLDARNSDHDAASFSQGWRKDALMDGCTGNLVAADKDQESGNYLKTVCTGKLVVTEEHQNT